MELTKLELRINLGNTKKKRPRTLRNIVFAAAGRPLELKLVRRAVA